MIDMNKLRELVALMKDNDLSEIDIDDGKETITLKRGGVPAMQAPMAFAPAPAAVAAAPAPAAAAPGTAVGVAAGAGIESPMVGTCYLSPNPDSAPFVKPGQQVTPDTVVCLIEAMKVFNEIKAEKTGIVEQVLVKNGQAVEFGQRMFSVKL